jgi:hypothetical protein
MARQARIDALGALHHIIIRGIERIAALKVYPLTGHSGLMGQTARAWQDTEHVLALFGKSAFEARRNLQRHVAKWFAKGHCPELTGGGLVRSAGGWRAIKAAYRDGIRLASDKRILGGSEFVETTLKAAGEDYDRRMRLHHGGIDLSAVVETVCRYFGIDEKELTGPTKRPKIARVRALIGHIGTRDLSISGSEVAHRLNIDRSAISRAVQRARHDAELMAIAKTILTLLKPEISQQ